MSIAALSPSAVRQIGSTKVLVDPSSVVKELIDNSLDARATNISVEVSTNTIDVIQVKDNGHSISAEDRPMICRRYCTSKIRDFSDLKGLGGKCLGFRGEALASLAEMSGSLNMTVRVEGEPVAALLKIGRSGNIEMQGNTSHPIGTTVRATNFFQSLPVRKQDALKHSAKHLKHIKHTMQAYALARPATRFSLRVLKSKTDKVNFLYAPKPGASVEDAAYKIIGINNANQCTWSVIESHGFKIEAFLPKPKGDATKVGNIGQFISVDSRPVSIMRGTFKQIASLFKEKLKKSSANFEGVKDPFLCMNIVCPPDSYDPNIEPAKDDVMFDDASKVIEAVEELLQVVYPANYEPPPTIPAQQRAEEDIFDLSKHMAEQERTRKGAEPTPISQDQMHVYLDEQMEDDHLQHIPKRRRTWKSNMFEDNEPDHSTAGLLQHENEDFIEMEMVRNDLTLSNPFTIAKMNARLRNKEPSSGNLLLATPFEGRMSEQVNSTPGRNRAVFQHLEYLPSPRASSPAHDNHQNPQWERPTETIQTPVTPRTLPPNRAITLPTPEGSITRSINGFLQDQGTPLSAIPEAPRSKRLTLRKEQPRRAVNKPFKSPLNLEADNWFEHLPSQNSPRPIDRRRNQVQAQVDSQHQRTLREMIRSAADSATQGRVHRNDRSNHTAQEPVQSRVRRFHSPIVENDPCELPTRRPSSVTSNTTLVNSPMGSSHLQSQPSIFEDEPSVDQPNERSDQIERYSAASASAALPDDFSHTGIPGQAQSDIIPENPIHQMNGSSNCEYAPPSEESARVPNVRRRRTSSKPSLRAKRNKSMNDAHLPLGSVPADAQLHNVAVHVRSSAADISRRLSDLDRADNLLAWGSLPDPGYGAFTTADLPSLVMDLAECLGPLLRIMFPDEEPVEQLDKLLMDAIHRHNRETNVTPVN